MELLRTSFFHFSSKILKCPRISTLQYKPFRFSPVSPLGPPTGFYLTSTDSPNKWAMLFVYKDRKKNFG